MSVPLPSDARVTLARGTTSNEVYAPVTALHLDNGAAAGGLRLHER